LLGERSTGETVQNRAVGPFEREVAALRESNSTATVNAVIPAVAPGAYHLIACANDDHRVAEASADNNCLSSAQTFTIGVTTG
jgi:hypothetical protein